MGCVRGCRGRWCGRRWWRCAGCDAEEAAALAGISWTTLERRWLRRLWSCYVTASLEPNALTLADREEIRVGIERGETDADDRSTRWGAIAARSAGRSPPTAAGPTIGRIRAQDRADRRRGAPSRRWTETRPWLWDEVQACCAPRSGPRSRSSAAAPRPSRRATVVGVARGDLPSDLRAGQRRAAQRTGACLRSGRAQRRPRTAGPARSGSRIVGMVNISERPAEVDDRAVPGHWEGDLIIGARNASAVATVVERTTRIGMLIKLDNKHRRARRRPPRRHTSHGSPPSWPAPSPGTKAPSSPPTPPSASPPASRLLLRPALTLAARHQRELERPRPPVPPQRHRPVHPHPRRPRPHRRPPQRTPPQDPRMGYSSRTIQPTCRDHHLKPPTSHAERGWVRSWVMATPTDLTQCTATELLDLYRRGERLRSRRRGPCSSASSASNPTLNAFCLVAADAALAAARGERGALAARRAGRVRSTGCRRRSRTSILTQGLADAARQPHGRPGPGVGRRRPGHGPAARGRRGAARQDDDARVRLQGRDQLAADRHHPQPVGHDEDAWRLVGRHGGRRRRRARPAQRRHRWRRIGAHPGRVLRQLRAEAELRPRAGVPAVAVRDGVAPRPAHDERHRRGVDAQRAAASRCPGLDVAAADDTDYLVGLDDGMAGLRVAYSPTLGYAGNVDPEIAAAVAEAVRSSPSSAPGSRRSTPGSTIRWRSRPGCGSAGAWTLWNQLTPQQQAVTDPDFAAEARLGAPLSNLEVQRLVLRRGELGSTMRQFMERFDLLVTPAVAVPAFEARPAGQRRLDPTSMLGWTPFSYPFNLTQQPACTIPCGLTRDGLADRSATRRPDVRRRAGAARRPGLRAAPPHPSPAALTIAAVVSPKSERIAGIDDTNLGGWAPSGARTRRLVGGGAGSG